MTVGLDAMDDLEDSGDVDEDEDEGGGSNLELGPQGRGA
jgi:hypothetical protein